MGVYRPNRPMVFPCGIRAPGRRLAQINLVLKNVPGALSKVAQLLGLLRVNILSGHITAFPGEELGRMSNFVDLTDTYVTLEELLRRLRAIDVVIEAEGREADLPGIIINTTHFPITFMGEEAIIMDVRQISYMFGRLHEVFESGAYTILYEMGLMAGRFFAREVREHFSVEGMEALKVIADFAVARGWCIPEFVEFDEEKPRLVVRLRDLFECRLFKGRKNKPNSHFMRGILAGILEELFGVKIKVKEEKCVAIGDPYCEFVAERYEALE